MATDPIQFRFSADVLQLIESLKKRLGMKSRADVLRHAVTRLAQAEGLSADLAAPKPGRPKKSVKS